MNIEEIKLSDLKPYEKNPRKNEEAVNYVAKSIKEFGFKVPIVIDKDNVIIAGHTRYRASQKLGLESVPCIRANDLSDEQVKAYRLADNKVSEFSQWDFSELEQELINIEVIDMSEFGFFNVEDNFLDNFFEEEKPVIAEESKKKFKIVIEFEDEEEAQQFLEMCKEQDLKCKMEA